MLRVGDEIEIRPGIVVKDSQGNASCTPIKSTIVSLLAGKPNKKILLLLIYLEQNDLLYAAPGGLIGVGLKIDPSLTKSNRLVGNVIFNIKHNIKWI